MQESDSFEGRIARNNRYYDMFARNVEARSQQRDFTRAFAGFARLLPAGGTVLDIGCGTGEHLAVFRGLGFEPVGIEPSSVMRGIAAEKGVLVLDGTFEALDTLELPPIHGVWCAASLLHVPEEGLADALAAIARRLASGAPLYLTVRLGTGAKWDKWDDAGADAERLIQLYGEDELRAALVAAGFEIDDVWIEDSTWGRPSRWISIIATKG